MTDETPSCLGSAIAWRDPATFVAAFVIGEGLIAMLGYTGQQTPPVWAVLVAGVPALTVFVLPGALAAVFGRRALALGKREALAPVIVGATIGGGFVLVNLVSFALTRLFG